MNPGSEETEKLPIDPHEQYLHEYHQKLGRQLLSGEITLAEFDQKLTANRQALESRVDHDGLLKDFLTHNGFAKAMEVQIFLARRYPEQIGCLFALDLDHLKEVNNNFGHLSGDKLIRAYGEVCQRLTRPSDIKAKLGGDELVLYLPGISVEEATERAERIRRSLVPAIIQVLPDIPWDQTVSIGITPLLPTDTVDSLRQRADEALYEAKKQRDQVVVK